MRIRNGVALIWLLGCCSGALAQEDRYRVAGTVLLTQGRSVAMIVRDGGDTVSVAVGDELDNGRVVEISEHYVRVSFPGEDLLLPLSGGPGDVVPTTVSASTQPLPGQPVTDAVPHDLYWRHVPSKQLLFAVDELGARLQREGTQSGAPEDSGRALTSLLDGLIGFPKGAVVRSINGESFASVAQGLDIVEKLLEQPVVLRFELDGTAEARPLYVFPQ
jgi:hypothetical protein